MITLAEASTQLGNALVDGRPPSHDGSNHANDRRYHSLRDEARKAQSQHAHFAAEASKAYERGDKEKASQLSQLSKQHESDAARLNEEAAIYVLNANNTDSKRDEIDLHGLFVSEAIIALDARLNVSLQRQQPVLKAIVGKGLHSEDHIAKLRPVVMKHCQERGIPCEIEPHNAGVVLINVAGSGQQPMSHTGGPTQAYTQPAYSQPTYAQPQQQGYSQGYAQAQHGHGFSQQDIRQGINVLQKIFYFVRQCLA